MIEKKSDGLPYLLFSVIAVFAFAAGYYWGYGIGFDEGAKALREVLQVFENMKVEEIGETI